MPRLALPMFVVALALTGCGDPCANTEIASALSPDGRHRAVLFERNCGATTGFSSQVSVVESGAAVRGSGNVFVADDDHGQAVSGPWGGVWTEMRWLSDDQLLVSHAPKARIFTAAARASGVRVSYATSLPPP